jgi:hypothetical protein
MPVYSLTRDAALAEVAHAHDGLQLGHPPPGLTVIGSHKEGVIRYVARITKRDPQAVRRRLGTPQEPGSTERKFGVAVNWSLYKAPAEPEPDPPQQQVPAPPTDPIERRRLMDRVAFLDSALKEAERRAAEAEDIRAGVLGLTADPPKPQIVLPSHTDTPSGGRTAVLHLSDVHYGETILAEEMDGLNRYDSAIARARLGRFFSTAADLLTKHWKGDPPDEVILCLGGDLISGNIHAELEQTNYPAVPATVKEVGEHIAGGVTLLRNAVKSPMRIYSVPGNHGRMTLKPQSKGRSAGSLDLLATDFAEAATRGARLKDVTWYKASSPDCYFSTYGWHWLLTHGDAMGGRGGGTGFIGPMATIIKGHRKLVDTSWRSARPVHYVMTSHYHTTGKTTFGWANGSVCSYGEYARDLRADPEPACQNMLIVHPHYGVIDWKPLYLGIPSEGSLYGGPASIVRPVWSEAS